MSVSEPESDESPPLHFRILRAVPILLVLGLLVHFLLPRLDTIEDSLITLRTLKPWAIGLSLIMEVLSYVANGALLQSVIQLAGERVSLRRAAAIEIGAGSVALVAAGALGFGAAIYKWTTKRGVSADAALLASWLPSMFDAAALVVFALLSAIELLIVHQLSRVTVVALSIVVTLLAAVIAGAIALLARNDWLRAISTRAARLMKRLRPKWDAAGLLGAPETASDIWEKLRGGGWIRPASC